MAAHVRAHRYGGWKAHLVAAVVHAHLQPFVLHKLGQKQVGQRQREVAVGNGGTKGALARTLGIDVDPLVVARGIGKGLDALLADG